MTEMNYKHGHKVGGKPSAEYAAWSEMIRRCHKETHAAWKNYGARGISVCDRWRESFVNFLNDAGLKPCEKYDLDRINNNGNYEPGNVRWISRKENSRNTRVNLMIEIGGITQCASAWSEQFGLERHLVAKRHAKGIRGPALVKRSRKFRSA